MCNGQGRYSPALGVSVLHSKYGLWSTSPAWYGLGVYKFYLGIAQGSISSASVVWLRVWTKKHFRPPPPPHQKILVTHPLGCHGKVLLIKYITFEHFLRVWGPFSSPHPVCPYCCFSIVQNSRYGGCGGGYFHMLGIRVCEKRQGVV